MDVNIDCGTPTASMLTIKLLLNSIISTPGAKFMAIDIKDFYLNTPLDVDVTFGVNLVLEFVVIDDVVGEVRNFLFGGTQVCQVGS